MIVISRSVHSYIDLHTQVSALRYWPKFSNLPTSVFLNRHLHTDIPSWSFALAIDTTKVTADQALNSLADSENFISVTAGRTVLELQVRHAKPIMNLPDAHLFDHTNSRVGLQALNDITHSEWVRGVAVAHE
jgi:hypothetical protein